MNGGYIYIIKNKINDKVYIGQTLRSVEDRFKTHLRTSTRKGKEHYKIYKAMNKYGKENFYYEILESDIPKDEIDDKEIYWIEYYDSYHNGYNSTPGGDGRIIYKELDILYLIEGLKEGKQIQELANEFNVSRETIKRCLKSNGYTIKDIQNKKIALSKAQKKVDREKVKELHGKGLSVKEIASELNCNVKTVRRIKHELDLDFEMPRYDYSLINDEDIIKDKLDGMRVEDILKKYHISYGYYYKIWREYQQVQREKFNDYPLGE